MPKFLTYALLAFFFLACGSKNDAVVYNDKFVAAHYELETAIDSLSLCIERADIVGIEQAFYTAQKKLSKVKQVAEKNPAFAEDSTLSLSFSSYCENYEKSLPMFVSELKKTYNLPKEKYTLKQHGKLERLIEDFNRNRRRNIISLKNIQQQFAIEHAYKVAVKTQGKKTK